MNKMFTAVAILQLIEAGKVSLDATVGTYLPDYPNRDVAEKVTVRELLNHTGGTGDFASPEWFANRDSIKDHADYLKLLGARGLDHEPGKEFRYSNYGFILLGAIVEHVSGKSYYDYVEERIFKPAGMRSTDSLPKNAKKPNRAVSYTKRNGAFTASDPLPYRGSGAGGGYSTVGDLLKFAQALEAGKLISLRSLHEATRPQTPAGTSERQYGYGFIPEGEGALRSYGHGGGTLGVNGDLRIFPELGVVVVCLSNRDPPAAEQLVRYYAQRMPAQ
jgi:D-alanyl-D-alanine carboxypeptidase